MKEETEALEIVFYGTSGWFDSTSGATNCVGVFVNERDIVLFDLGTGVRKIDRESVRGKNVTVMLSHLHLDHCYGLHILPMFQPASLTIVIHESLKSYLETLFSFPFVKPRDKLGFPVEIRVAKDTTLNFDNFTIKTQALKHNTPVIGAQLHLDNTSICYCVDTILCDSLLSITKDCDILIAESCPVGGKKTNGFHLDIEQLKTVLTATHAEKAIITHFGARQYPDLKTKELLFTYIKDFHHNIVMAYDGLVIRS
ncbi:ribonuclease Z [Moorena sp. SIO3B2]|uniref:MBL fold metallo-hydrolase n=1 Tax=Moorena sp. SIO3B2 TaxID=2607827 RepID=UPI0013CD6374|nr:ribonuclease Z [Moorena sp. SIO3B2]NEP37440.1 ribonuclease Z [Moorena sp. SIO3B2]